MKRKSSQSFQNLDFQSKEVRRACLHVKKLLHIGVISFYILSCLSIETYASSTAGAITTPAQGDNFKGLGQGGAGKVASAPKPVSISDAGKAARDIAVTVTTMARDIGDTARSAAATITRPASNFMTDLNTAANAYRNDPATRNKVDAYVQNQKPPAQQTPKPLAQAPRIAATQPGSLPDNNFAQRPNNVAPRIPNNITLPSYRMPSASTFTQMPNIPNLNSTFKPVKMDMPFEITLTNLKYTSIPKVNLQIKPLATIKPIVNPALRTLQTQSFNNPTMPKITPINNTIVKPIASIKPITMPKPIVNTLRPIQTPKLVTSTIPKIKPISNTLVRPIASIKPLTMPKPIVSILKPLPMPNLAISAIPKIKPIDNILVKPIASIKPITMPKPIVNTLRPIQAPSFVKYTIPAITPIGNIMIKPIESIKPITMPKPIATNIKTMPMPKFAHVDVPSLNYMSKKFNFEVPEHLDTLTMPKVTPINIKMTPIRMPEVEIPKYAMPQITIVMPRVAVTEVKYQAINTQYVEKTIKLYDAKVMHDASRINSMISPSNNLQKYFSGTNALKIDLTKFIQNAPTQRKEIINQAQIYTNSVEVKKLKALDTWRNEYDKFLALSSNISNVVKETGEVDPASLDYLENVKENLDMLTRNITDMGIDKAAMQQVIKNSGETVINPLMKEKVPMPSTFENPSLKVLPGSMAPKIDIFNSLSRGVSNVFTSTVHAEEQ